MQQIILKSVAFVFIIFLAFAPHTALADIINTDATITPSEITMGESANVTLSMTGIACSAGVGVDAMLVIDRSPSMYPSCSQFTGLQGDCPDEDRISPAVNAAQNFLNRMGGQDRAGLVSFAGSADLEQGLSNDFTGLSNILSGFLPPADPPAFGTNIGEGIALATDHLLGKTPQNSSALIVLSDGEDTENSNPIRKAQKACEAGIQVFSIGLGNEIDPAMAQLACNGGRYEEAPTSEELETIYQSIATDILDAAGKNAVIMDTVPTELEVVSGSISNGGTFADGVVTWELKQLATNTELSYSVTGQRAGTYTIGAASVIYDDCPGNRPTLGFPNRTLVIDDPSPQNSESCGALDVVFVIDDTSSMGSAIANVREQAASLVDDIRTASAGNFQIGLITFKDDVRIIDGLQSGDAHASIVEANIRRIRATGGGLNEQEASDSALQVAVDSMGNGWRPSANKIIILITDARPHDQENGARWASQAAQRGIKIASIFVPSTQAIAYGYLDEIRGIMHSYGTITNGSYIETASNGDGTADAISAIVQGCGSVLEPMPEAESEPEMSIISPPSGGCN